LVRLVGTTLLGAQRLTSRPQHAAPLRVLIAATALAALGTLGLADAAPPQIGQRKIDHRHPAHQGRDQACRCNSGHGAQPDCRDSGTVTGDRPRTSPAASTAAGGGRLDLVRSVALLALLAALAVAGTWRRRRHRPREAV
jgi:hypothetical protein